eukprot:4306217-Ditylum_brightwellii.AAC.1
MLESSRDGQVAVQFAELLLRLASAKNISRILEKKFKGIRNTSKRHTQDSHNDRTQEETNTDDGYEEDLSSLFELYQSNIGYLYLLDDCSGSPMVDAGGSVYPIRVHNVSYILGKVLPLMIMGMALMR